MSVATWSPGSPLSAMTFHQRREYLRRRLIDGVTPEDVAAIMQALILKAVEGNLQALKLFLAYVIGRPELIEKLYLKQEEAPARPIAAPAPTAPPNRNSKPATPAPSAAVHVAPKSPTAPMPMAAVQPSAKLDAPAAKTQPTSQIDKPLVSPEEFERLIQQPIKAANLGDPRGVSVLAGPDQKNKRS